MASLAEYPGAIESLFMTNRVNTDGEYVLKLWCTHEGWVQVAESGLIVHSDPCTQV